MRLLISQGADIHAADNLFGTPLCLAILGRHVDVVQLLIRSNADVNQGCGLLGSAAHAACVAGDTAILDTLDRAGADLGARRLTCPITLNVFAALRFVLPGFMLQVNLEPMYAYSNAIVATSSPVALALVCGHEHIVRRCLDKQAVAPLGEKVSMSCLGAVNLLGNGFALGDFPLACFAAWQRNHRMLSLLLERGGDHAIRSEHSVSSDLIAALHAVVEPDFRWCGRGTSADGSSCIRLLVCHSVPVDAPDWKQWGRTALMRAAETTDLTLVEELLGMGASPNAIDGNGRTALMYAMQSGMDSSIACVELLCGSGADIGVIDNAGLTALDLASQTWSAAEYAKLHRVILAHDSRSMFGFPSGTCSRDRGHDEPTEVAATDLVRAAHQANRFRIRRVFQRFRR